MTDSSTSSDPHEGDFRETYEVPESPNHFADSAVEVVRPFGPCHATAALFDFDGTLSLIREGWPDVMIPMMVEWIQEVDREAEASELERLVTEFVFRLNGKQTIYQMLELVKQLQARGGTPRDPQWYKDAYHDRLLERIELRREALRTKNVSPDQWLVPGSLDLLERLKTDNVQLFLASGTDEVYVKEEVRLLGLDHYFEDRVFGAIDDYRRFSKAQIIERILADHIEDARQLIGFGDGYVEIQNLVEAGATAVGVASDEKNRSGQIDAWKRERLASVGAQLIVPDFSEADRLLECLRAGQT